MTNAEHIKALLLEAQEKLQSDQDAAYQIYQAIKLCDAADEEVRMWRNKYLNEVSKPR